LSFMNLLPSFNKDFPTHVDIFSEGLH
jgi:hypothetical protein